MLEDLLISCPYCGEAFGSLLDTTGLDPDAAQGAMELWEDCAVCCRPIRLRCQLAADGSVLALEALTDDDV